MRDIVRKVNTDYVALFLLNASGMVLELVASRLMSPYFGNSNFVWTAIIGIILLAGSLGNLIGGRLASSRKARGFSAILLLCAAIYIMVTPLINAPVLESIKKISMGTQASSVFGSVVFFLIPSTLLGVITPIIMKDRIGSGKEKGKESGRITAIIAIGSLVGTFVGGFWLIPSLGTRGIFVLLGIIIMMTVLLLKPWEVLIGRKMKMIFWITFVFTLALGVVAAIVVMNSNDWHEISIDTEYGRIIVEDVEYNGEPVRLYRQSGAYSSATFLDKEKKYELVFDYVKKYDEMFKYLDVNDAAMIGGAAYQYPKYFISHYKDKKIDVIEIDQKSTEIAKKYFFLGDLIDEYGEDRLGLYNEDGRVFFENTEKKYDAVLSDVFSGETPVGSLSTKEAAKLIKSHLKKDGVYMLNVLGSVIGEKSRFLKAEVKTLKKVFSHVCVMSVEEEYSLEQRVNWMVIATDNNKYEPEECLDLDLSHAIMFTDDYAPVEQLVLEE